MDRGRSRILLTGHLCLEGEWRPFRVKDLSATGLKGNGIDELPAGIEVKVRVRESEPIVSRVIWSDGRLFGLQFKHPIIPEKFRTKITGSYVAPKEPEKPKPIRRPV